MSKYVAPAAGSLLAILGYFTPLLSSLFAKYVWLGPVIAGLGTVLGSLAPQPQK